MEFTDVRRNLWRCTFCIDCANPKNAANMNTSIFVRTPNRPSIVMYGSLKTTSHELYEDRPTSALLSAPLLSFPCFSCTNHIPNHSIIKRDGSTSQVGIGRVLNGVLYVTYESSSKIYTVKRCKTLFIWKPLDILIAQQSHDFSSQ